MEERRAEAELRPPRNVDDGIAFGHLITVCGTGIHHTERNVLR